MNPVNPKIEETFTAAQIRDIMEDFSEIERVVMACKSLAGMSIKEIAKMKKLPESAIKKIFSVARSRLYYRLFVAPNRPTEVQAK